MEQSNIKNVIFDLGGVLIDLNIRRSVEAFNALLDKDAITTSSLPSAKDLLGGGESKLVKQYQRGEISTDQFVEQILTVCRPGTTREQVVDAWFAMLIGLPQHRLQRLIDLKKAGYRVYILSNINDLHVEWTLRLFNQVGMPQLDGVFFSNEIHLDKPDQACYQYVIEHTGIRPDETLYIDDLTANIEAGRAAGLVTLQAEGDAWLSTVDELVAHPVAKRMFALVTGASSGIGLEYTRQLARDYHYPVLLVSNQEKELLETSQMITKEYGVETKTLYINLAEANAAEQIMAFCDEQQISIEVLVNNAGILIFQPFCTTPVGKLETLLMLHMVTLTKLCRLIGERMAERGHGYILNMSSMTAWMAMPGIQCYNATKSYVLNFSKALWYEMRNAGVHVLAITPGSINTGLLPFPPMFAKLLRGVGITMEPKTLVKSALRALFRTSKKKHMPGLWNYIIVPIINHLPDWLVFFVMRRLPVIFAPFDKKRTAK